MISLLLIIVGIFVLVFLTHYTIHISNAIITCNNDRYVQYGWGTIFLFKNLHKGKIFSRLYGATYCTSNHDCVINRDNEFLFNEIYILFDPISFTLVKLFCWWKYLNGGFLNSKLFKTYAKIESEKILDKLTSD